MDFIDVTYYILLAGIAPFAIFSAGLTAAAATMGMVALFFGRSYIAGLCEYR